MNHRMSKMPQIAPAIFFPHLFGIEDMNLRARHVDFLRQWGNQVGIKLIFAAAPGDVGPRPAHQLHKGAAIIPHFLQLPLHGFLQKAGAEAPVPDQGIHQGQQQLRLQPGRQGRGLIQIGTAQNARAQVNPPPGRQQSHEGAAQRAAISPGDAPAPMANHVILDLFGFRQHGGEFRRFRLVKAVVTDAQHPEIPGQIRQHAGKIALPMAAGAGQQQERRRVLRAEGVHLHLPTPFKKPLLARSSVSSASS